MDEKVVYFCFSLYFLQIFVTVSSTSRPIIGVLAQELPDRYRSWIPKNGSSFIAASYVKAVEASGARVVPVFINQTESYYRELLSSINGVVFPGGGAPLKLGQNGYYDAIVKIYNIAKEMNDKRNYFPLLAVCLGFEAILKIANNHTDIQTLCNVQHENYPLNFLPASKRSLLYFGIPERIYIYLRYFNVTVNQHYWCTTHENFTKTSLPEEWLVTTDNVNQHGLKFISSVENKRYPFFAVQFHPEKPMFEWKISMNIPHSTFAIQANRYFYDTFVHQARLNFNQWKVDGGGYPSLIYHYAPVYSELHTPYEQIYVF